ncbi:MAG: hypothetical protein ABSF22_03725 [Bryobacteraceae bacterium]
MATARYVYRQDHWLGYFEEYPDYLTQGESLEDLYRDIASGEVPGVRRVADHRSQGVSLLRWFWTNDTPNQRIAFISNGQISESIMFDARGFNQFG